MRDRLKVTGFVLWLLATVILGTILVAWLIYPMEIGWLRIQNRTGLAPTVIQKNFHAVFDQSFYLEAGDAGFSILSGWSPSFPSSQVPLSPDPGLIPGLVASSYTIYSNSDA